MGGPVVIATGGFGADFSQDSLLAKYRPDLMHLPTSNGEHCTGDGIKMGEALGARTIDLEWVQVHPTGLVNPKDPDAKVKFLAAEALRGVGGLEMTTSAEVIGANGRPIEGLYCAGEVMGGVHGNNRLGGNSLLDCVVYGRVAGQACAKYMLGDMVKPVDLKKLSAGGVVGGGTQKSVLSGGSYEDDPSGKPAAEAKSAAAVPTKPTGAAYLLSLTLAQFVEKLCCAKEGYYK